MKAKAGNVNRADVLTSVAEFEEALKERLGKWQRDFQSGWELGLSWLKLIPLKNFWPIKVNEER